MLAKPIYFHQKFGKHRFSKILPLQYFATYLYKYNKSMLISQVWPLPTYNDPL